MATSKCPKCDGTSFEAEVATVSGYDSEIRLVRCAQCGAVVGVLPRLDAGVLAMDLYELMKELKKKLDSPGG
jgi:hypothetical protein